MHRNCLGLFVTFLFAIGCTGLSSSQPTTAASGDLDADYLAAVRAVQPYNPKNLRDLKPLNTDGTKTSLLFTLLPNDVNPPEKGEYFLEKELWIALAAEVNEKVPNILDGVGHEVDKRRLRLNQLLGIPPKSAYKRVAFLWVPADAIDRGSIFRPCRNPNTQSLRPYSESEEYPWAPCWIGMHKDWIDSTIHVCYDETDANGKPKQRYPWTRLGYTYDWEKNVQGYGLSEYVIRDKSKAIICRIMRTEDFLNDPRVDCPTAPQN